MLTSVEVIEASVDAGLQIADRGDGSAAGGVAAGDGRLRPHNRSMGSEPSLARW